jgi:SAM-dependent methyltransferase
MTKPNYESKWWGYIYDQMMAELPELENNRRFYEANLRDAAGPVLECACGTGIFFLPLLAAGYDMYGFDISETMISALRSKAQTRYKITVNDRVTVQDFETFHYRQLFDAILIPTNSFGMLITQESQIRTLRNIYNHLAPNGKLLLDLRLAGIRTLFDASETVEGQWYTWTHPETGLPIRQRLVGNIDLDNQRVLDQCYIDYEGQTEVFPMTGRWVFKEEFKLLLRLAGFEHFEYFRTPEREPLQVGLDEAFSYWIAYKT